MILFIFCSNVSYNFPCSLHNKFWSFLIICKHSPILHLWFKNCIFYYRSSNFISNQGYCEQLSRLEIYHTNICPCWTSPTCMHSSFCQLNPFFFLTSYVGMVEREGNKGEGGGLFDHYWLHIHIFHSGIVMSCWVHIILAPPPPTTKLSLVDWFWCSWFWNYCIDLRIFVMII